jgi:YHS domain-containing protein
MRKLIFLFVILCGLTLSAFAQTAKPAQKDSHEGHQHDHATKTEKADQKFLGKGDGVETCPVTGEVIVNKDVKGDFFGRTIYFCCPGCLVKVKQSPAAYLKKTHEEQVAAIKDMPKSEGHDHGAEVKEQDKKDGEQKFLGKGDGVETCPVTGEPVNKNVKAEFNGQTIYACCEMCLETIKKSPDLYLKKNK